MLCIVLCIYEEAWYWRKSSYGYKHTGLRRRSSPKVVTEKLHLRCSVSLLEILQWNLGHFSPTPKAAQIMNFYCSAQTIRSESSGGWKLFNLQLHFLSQYPFRKVPRSFVIMLQLWGSEQAIAPCCNNELLFQNCAFLHSKWTISG